MEEMEEMSTTSSTTWKYRAAAAWKAKEAERQWQIELARRKQAAMLATRLWNILGVQTVPTGPEIVLDGVKFVLLQTRRDGPLELMILQPCPKCGHELISWPIRRLEQVGRELAGQGELASKTEEHLKTCRANRTDIESEF